MNDVDKILSAREQSAGFTFNAGQETQEAHSSWYRGEHCNFNPTKKDFEDPDAILKFILKGWLPERGFVTKALKTTAFGSCFASHISGYLQRKGYTVLNKGSVKLNAYIVQCGEGMVNTYALLQQFEWAFEGKQFSQNLWHGYDAEEYAYDEAIRRDTLEIFKQTELFIITIGLSEIWHDKVSGEVFWRAIPIRSFDPARHGFRVSTTEENRTNIEKIYHLIRKHRPEAHILFTLSPIPLVATFRPQACISANAVSKAILRAALDEVLRAHTGDTHLHYFPSYEIVTSVFRDPFVDDRRHVRPEILNVVMRCFERHYCDGPADMLAENFYGALAYALAVDGQLAAAERTQEAALSFGGNTVTHQYQYATILAAQGKNDRAVPVLGDVLAADRNHQAAAALLNKLTGK